MLSKWIDALIFIFAGIAWVVIGVAMVSCGPYWQQPGYRVPPAACTYYDSYQPDTYCYHRHYHREGRNR